MAKKRAAAYPPANATAVCLYHDGRLMNDKYIRKRGCLMRRKPCKHLRWLTGGGADNGAYCAGNL